MTLKIIYVIFQPLMAESLAPFLASVNTREVFNHLVYDDSVNCLLQEIESIGEFRDSPQQLARYVFHPAHLIAVTVNHKIAHPEALGMINAINLAVKVGLDVFSFSPDLSSSIESYRQCLLEYGNDTLFNKRYKRREREVNWSNVYESYDYTEPIPRLKRGAQSKDILLVALGGAAYTSALDVFTRYCEETGSTDSLLYPVRFSIYRRDDNKPCVSPEEVEYLKMVAKNRFFVLFDLFTGWGYTIARAAEFMQQAIDPKEWGVLIKEPDNSEYYSEATMAWLKREDVDRVTKRIHQDTLKYLAVTEHLHPKMML